MCYLLIFGFYLLHLFLSLHLFLADFVELFFFGLHLLLLPAHLEERLHLQYEKDQVMKACSLTQPLAHKEVLILLTPKVFEALP